jgi:Zn-dependent protease
MESITPDMLLMGLVWLAVFLFSTTLHEAAHAFVALKLGDETAYEGGQVTLDPRPHIARAPVGMLLVPIVSYAFSIVGGGAGWMMGWASVPYDPTWADRYPRRAAWMSLAGPAANFLLVLVAGLSIRVGMAGGYLAAPDSIDFTHLTMATQPGLGGLATLLSILFSLNLVLFAFNLLPLPPLDGAGVLPLLINERAAQRYQEFMRQWSLLGLVVAWNVFGKLFGPLFSLALKCLYPEVSYS